MQPGLTLLRASKYINEHGFPCPVEVLDIRKLARPGSIVTMYRYAKTLKSRGYGLVHIFFNDASIIAPVFLSCFGIKVIISRRDMGYWYTTFTRILLRINSFFVDAAITNCEAVRQVTHENELIALEDIRVIYNGYMETRQNAVIEARESTLPFPAGGSTVIGLIANIRPIKKIDVLIDAFALVKQKYRDVVLVIVGGGDPSPLLQQAKKAGVDADIHFLGVRDDIGHLLSFLDIGVLCSESEGFSNTLVEYVHAGVPVVCTDVGGNPEIIRHKETGILVPPNNATELAAGICQLLADPERAGAMADKARSEISRMCDFNSMIDNHLRFYDEVSKR